MLVLEDFEKLPVSRFPCTVEYHHPNICAGEQKLLKIIQNFRFIFLPFRLRDQNRSTEAIFARYVVQ